MAPSSITIKIEFGPESVAGNMNNVSLQGDIPTPFFSGELSSAALGKSADALPTPFDNAAQGMAFVNEQAPIPSSVTVGLVDVTAPAPSPDMEPARDTGGEEDVPSSGKKNKK
jgi:hypothetical protein